MSTYRKCLYLSTLLQTGVIIPVSLLTLQRVQISSNAIIWMKKKIVKNNAVSCFLKIFSKCLLRHLSNYDRTLDSHGTQKVHHVNLKAIKGETKKKNSKIQKART